MQICSGYASEKAISNLLSVACCSLLFTHGYFLQLYAMTEKVGWDEG